MFFSNEKASACFRRRFSALKSACALTSCAALLLASCSPESRANRDKDEVAESSQRPDGCVDFMIFENSWNSRERSLDLLRAAISEAVGHSIDSVTLIQTEIDSWNSVRARMIFDSSSLQELANDLDGAIVVQLKLLAEILVAVQSGQNETTLRMDANLNEIDLEREFKQLRQAMSGC